VTTHECFQKAEKIETIAREIYERLASDFKDEPGAVVQFQRLANEEAQHAQRIQLLGRTHRGKHIFDGIAGVEEALETGVRDSERLLAEVTAGSWGLDLDRVTSRMIEMEERLARFHAETMAQGADPSVQKLFQALAQQDRHHRALIEGLRKIGKQQGT
jgi:rubrerythrin